MVNAKLLNVFKERLDKYLKNRSLWDHCVSKPHEAELIDEKTHGLSAYLKEIGLFYSVFPVYPLRMNAEDMTVILV